MGRYDERPLFEKAVDPRVVRVIRKLLAKDPEARYQTADDLASDLESWVPDPAGGRRREPPGGAHPASFPLVCVLSFEEDRVLASIRDIARALSEDRKKPRRLYVRSALRGLRDDVHQLVNPETLEDPTAAIIHVIENPEDAIYVFLDLHRHYSPVTTRLIRDAARAIRSTRKSVLFLSPFYQVPDELQKEVALAVFQLPDRQQIEQVLAGVTAELGLAGKPVDLTDDDRSALLRAASGLTANEADLAFRRGRSAWGP